MSVDQSSFCLFQPLRRNKQVCNDVCAALYKYSSVSLLLVSFCFSQRPGVLLEYNVRVLLAPHVCVLLAARVRELLAGHVFVFTSTTPVRVTDTTRVCVLLAQHLSRLLNGSFRRL